MATGSTSSPVTTISYARVTYNSNSVSSSRSVSLPRSCLAGAALSLPGAALLAIAACAVGCSYKTETAARSKDEAALSVKVEPVREESMRRAVEVVGTLAAVDEVMVSAEAEGRVSRLAADLGDRVTAGQPLVELDREKPQYTLDEQKAALA